MTTRRTRRVSAPPIDQQDERSYIEDDYATPEPAGLSHGEVSYAEQMDWIPETSWDEHTSDAFAPDEEESLPQEWVAEPDIDVPADEVEYVPFPMTGYDPMYQSETDYMYDGEPLDDDLLTEEEQEELRRSHWQLLSNLADLAGVILGTVAILVLVMLLVSLLNWLVGDMSQSFTLLQKHL